MELRQIEPFALANHGLVTLDAVRDAGLSKTTWNRAINGGQLELVHAGVARVVGSPITQHQRIAAALLAAGKGALASHRSAAFLWEERRMTRLIKRWQLPPVEFHQVILGYEVDFRVVGTPVVLQCDGWEYHDKRRRNFERDRKQDAELTAAGYITVRFTWTMLTRQPQWVASMIRSAVQRWTADPV